MNGCGPYKPVHSGQVLAKAALAVFFIWSIGAEAQDPAPEPLAVHAASAAALETAGAKEEGAFWPFSAQEAHAFFDENRGAADLRENEALVFWHTSLQWIAQQRQAVHEIEAEQESQLDELQEARGASDETLLESAHRPKVRELITEWQQKDDNLQRIDQSMRKRSREVARRATEIREILGQLQTQIDQWDQQTTREEQTPTPEVTLAETEPTVRPAQRVADAIALLDRVAANPTEGSEILLREIDGLVRTENPVHRTPIVAAFEEQITRLERRNRFLFLRLEANDRELTSLKTLVRRMAEREEELERLAAEKTLAEAQATDRANVETEARKRAEKVAETETVARIEAERKATEQGEARKETEQQAQDAGPGMEIESKYDATKIPGTVVDWMGRMGNALTQFFHVTPIEEPADKTAPEAP